MEHVRPIFNNILLQSFPSFTLSRLLYLACAVLKSSRTSASTDGGGCLMEDPGVPAAPVVDAPDAEVPVVVVDVVEVDVGPEPDPDS